MNQPRHVKGGDSGFDVTAYRRALDRYRADPAAQAGQNWPRVTDGENYHATGRSLYDTETKLAVAAVKKRHPYIQERGIGPQTFDVLSPYVDGWGWSLLKLARPKTPYDPLAGRGVNIGLPYQGTHDHPNTSDPMHNWESCNAVDMGRAYGSPVYAYASGTITSQIGPLNSNDPHLLGLRLHLKTSTNEAYYAHLSRLVVHAGQHVSTGQILGYSGSANGVSHLHFAAEHGDPGLAFGEPSPGYRDRRYPG